MRSKQTISQKISHLINNICNYRENKKVECVKMISSHYWSEPYLKGLTGTGKSVFRTHITKCDMDYLVMIIPELCIIRYLNEEGYAEKLAFKSKQLIYEDDYGDINIGSWQNELDRFIDNKKYDLMRVASSFPTFVQQISKRYKLQYLLDQDKETIQSTIFNYINDLSSEITDDDNPIDLVEDGFDYEIAVGEILTSYGWSVRLTGRGADQGVDLIAEKAGISYAIQCKFYSSPVGNSAVQQIHAGSGFYEVQSSAVVSNATYTKSAMQLAQSLGVRLLHHDSLDQL